MKTGMIQLKNGLTIEQAEDGGWDTEDEVISDMVGLIVDVALIDKPHSPANGLPFAHEFNLVVEFLGDRIAEVVWPEYDEPKDSNEQIIY